MRSPAPLSARAAAAVLALAVVAAFLGAPRRQPEADDPYVAHLLGRIEALRPTVERALGAELPARIRVVVVSRAELGPLQARQHETLLRAVEGRDAVLPETGGGPTLGTHGWVDGDGTLHVCREELEGAPADADPVLAAVLWWTGRHEPLGRAAVDRVLVHELVHVHQHDAFGAWSWLRASRDRADLAARAAVLEGHAEVVTSRVLGPAPDEPPRSPRGAELAECYHLFEISAETEPFRFRYAQSRAFVASAVARLGYEDAVRRMFASPPSMLQVTRPETWPGAPLPDAGLETVARRVRAWLRDEGHEPECDPQPPAAFLGLLALATDTARRAAEDAFAEAQRFETGPKPLWYGLRGHLLAARDEAGARALRDAWVEAAKARDALVPSNPKFARAHVLESRWSAAEVDGLPVVVAERRYRNGIVPIVEHTVVVQRGRHVLELRVRDEPGGERAALRLARRFLACGLGGGDDEDAASPDWRARWRFAVAHRGDAGVRALLADPDADVRAAAFRSVVRRGTLSADERARARTDADPFVRLTALRCRDEDAEAPPDDLVAALGDADPWVVAGAFAVANAQFDALPSADVERGLRSPHATVRRAAAANLDYAPYSDDDAPATLALVRLALADDDPRVREDGAGPLLHVGATPGLAETFVALLTGDDEDLRRDAIVTLSIRDPVPGTAEAVAPILGETKLRSAALEILAKLGAESLLALPRIREVAASDPDPSIRLLALVAAGAIDGDRSESLAAVRAELTSGDAARVRRATDALELLGADAAPLADALAACLASEDRRVVLPILDVAKRFPDPPPPLVDAVERLRASDDPVLRRAADDAGERLRERAARR